jgi:hypothetical protein
MPARVHTAFIGIVALAFTLSCHPSFPRPLGWSSGSHDILLGTDIPSAYWNALDAIEHLRPEYLAPWPSSATAGVPTRPTVYLNGHRLIDVTSLRSVPTSWVAEVRFIRTPLPGKRYGSDHAERAILVTTRSFTP